MYKNFPVIRPLAAAAVLVALVGSAHAQATFYTSQASFLAAVQTPGVDNFTELNAMQGQTPTTLSQMAGSVGYTMSSSTGSGLYVWANQSSSAVSTFGDSLVLSGFTGGATAIGLQLDAPYIAVRGMSTSTPAPAVTQVPAALSGTMTLSVLLQNGQTTTETIANPYSSNGLNPLGFFGFTASSPIQSVTLSTTPGSSGAPGDFAGTTYPMVSEVDMSTANVAAVPEPSSYALLLAGLAVVGGIATRRSGRTQAR